MLPQFRMDNGRYRAKIRSSGKATIKSSKKITMNLYKRLFIMLYLLVD